MAYGECCQNCIYGIYKGKDQYIIGAQERDVWCDYYYKWVGCGGKCKNYEEDK